MLSISFVYYYFHLRVRSIIVMEIIVMLKYFIIDFDLFLHVFVLLYNYIFGLRLFCQKCRRYLHSYSLQQEFYFDIYENSNLFNLIFVNALIFYRTHCMFEWEGTTDFRYICTSPDFEDWQLLHHEAFSIRNKLLRNSNTECLLACFFAGRLSPILQSTPLPVKWINMTMYKSGPR